MFESIPTTLGFTARGTTDPLLWVFSGFSGFFEWFLDDVYGTGLNWLADLLGIDVLGYPCMQRAYLAAICIAVIGPLVGTFLVHRELSMIGDTLAHTAFAGVAVGLFINSALSTSISPLLTALVVAVGAALLIELLVEYGGARSDASLAIVLTGGFALGSVLITATDGGIAVGIDAYLFGNLATVSTENVSLLLVMSAVVVILVALAYRPLLYVTFDATAARAARINISRYNRLMVVLTALIVVSAMQIIGVILVAAMLVVPVVGAARIAHSFKRSLLLSALAAEVAVVVGVTVSYIYGWAAGGAIVLAAITVYLLTILGDVLVTGAGGRGAAQWLRTRRRHRSRTPVEADGGEKE